MGVRGWVWVYGYDGCEYVGVRIHTLHIYICLHTLYLTRCIHGT